MQPYLIAIATVTLVFLIHFFLSKSISSQSPTGSKSGDGDSNVRQVLLQRILGFLLFGIAPMAAMLFLFEKPFYYYGFSTIDLSKSLFWIPLLTAIILVLNYVNARSKANLQMYPQMRVNKWTIRMLIISALSWMVYLAAYEFMFRGFFLFAIYETLGTTAAIVITTSIYSLVHVPKGAKEAVGAIPLGILLGYLSLITGNILIAYVVHVSMALTNEWFSLRAHPDMKIFK